MHPSKRRVIYYTIFATSLLWICGTITFLFFDDIEVTLAVKRKSIETGVAEHYLNSNSEVTIVKTHEKGSNHPEPLENVKQVQMFIDFSDAEKMRVADYESFLVPRDYQLPGELGTGVTAQESEKEKEKLGYEKHAFNQLVSDKISIHRSLKDYRNDQ